MKAIFAHDKWDTYVVRAEDGTLESAALILLSERVKQGFWYYDEDADVAETIVADKDGAAAWRFLESRCEYEYEWVEERNI